MLDDKKYRLPDLALLVLGLALSGVSIYLTQHYYQIIFPENLNTGTLCNISQFWNCDAAAFSPLGNILNVPTSFLGLIFGLLVFFGALIKRPIITRTNFFLSLVNLLGCLFLFGYSLAFLGGLCPGCTAYYLLSLATALVFLKEAKRIKLKPYPSIFILAIYGLFALAVMAGAYVYNDQRFKEQDVVFKRWIKQMREAPVIDEASIHSAMWLWQSTPKFADAPLRVIVFSDFQCPWCKVLSRELEKIAPRYTGRINIQYVFFPLNGVCNSSIKSARHPLACIAARLAYCAREDFLSIHDEIYAHQENLTREWIEEKAQDLNVKACYDSKESEDAVRAIIEQAKPFDIGGAPVMFVNGRKIGGFLPPRALIALFDAFSKNSDGPAPK